MKEGFFVFLVVLVGFFLRVYGLNWDSGYHLHPDERMIVMVSERLTLPQPLTLKSIFSPQSSLNPHFFAYGSFPLYLLKSTSWLLSQIAGKNLATYQNLPLVGRPISALFDAGVILLLFAIGRSVFNYKVGLLASFLYATCVFPIQSSHFYTTDPILNFFTWLTIWLLLRLDNFPTIKSLILVGVSFGAALATKVSAAVLVVPVAVVLLLNSFSVVWSSRTKRNKKNLLGLFLKTIFGHIFPKGILIASVDFLSFLVLEPYALLSFPEFKRQILQQSQLTKNPYAFPYTLQFVDTTPYIYQMRNMIVWGMGVAAGIGAVLGTAWYLFNLTKGEVTKKDWRQKQNLVIISFGLAYFLVVGRFAAKFMRYFLPLYPFFLLIEGYFLLFLWKKLKPFGHFILGIFVFLHLGWLLSFLSIYTRPHSRVQASEWILKNIPPGSVLAVEHWDDVLPLWGGERYRFVQMPMYEPDNSLWKWRVIEENLKKADYLILASNRLYRPLTRLKDCSKYKVCYPKTAKFYKNLFTGRLGFRKVAEFTSYPSLLGLKIKDDFADESFTVYDHPKVIIFEKDKETKNSF